MRRKEHLPHRRWLCPIHPALFAGWAGGYNFTHATQLMRRKEHLPHRRWPCPIRPTLFAGWVGGHQSTHAPH